MRLLRPLYFGQVNELLIQDVVAVGVTLAFLLDLEDDLGLASQFPLVLVGQDLTFFLAVAEVKSFEFHYNQHYFLDVAQWLELKLEHLIAQLHADHPSHVAIDITGLDITSVPRDSEEALELLPVGHNQIE